MTLASALVMTSMVGGPAAVVDDLRWDVPADAPTRESEVLEVPRDALGLRETLLDRRASLLNEQKPGLGAPVVLMALSGVFALGTLVSLVSGQPWYSPGLWLVPALALAVHLTLGLVGTVVLPQRIAERERFDSQQHPTAVDGDLVELSPPTPGAETLGPARFRALRERELLRRQSDQLLESRPRLGDSIAELCVGQTLFTGSLVGWTALIASGGTRLLVACGSWTCIFSVLLWCVVAAGTAAGLGGLILTVATAVGLPARNAERERIDREVRDLNQRIAELDRAR